MLWSKIPSWFGLRCAPIQVCSYLTSKLLLMGKFIAHLLISWNYKFDFRIRKANSKARIAVDNTFLTPWVCKPLEFGVDIVMHSVTKYINGHSDVIMGALLTNDTLLNDELYKIQKYRGATPSAFDCFLVMRSLATLELRFYYQHSSTLCTSLSDWVLCRMQQHMKSGLEVATFLSTHPDVSNVHHPLLPNHPQHKLALDQHKIRHSGDNIFIKSIAINSFTS